MSLTIHPGRRAEPFGVHGGEVVVREARLARGFREAEGIALALLPERPRAEEAA